MNISNGSSVPLYLQIIDQLKYQIYSGELKNGELLPSVRILARELDVSIITVRRAYSELEREGFLASVPAKGTFVSNLYLEQLKIQGSIKLDELLTLSVRLAKVLNVPFADVVQSVNKLYDEMEQTKAIDLLCHLKSTDSFK